ncbi:hypothetical protein V2J09_016418 [Rumex salicifolius]
MKHYADAHRRDVHFLEGDLVFLRLQPYRQQTLARRVNQKLTPRFFGPYKVLRAIGSVAYELELPSACRLHPVFHVSLLKPAKGTVAQVSALPPPINDAFEFTVEPAAVLAHRWRKIGVTSVLELLVRCDNRPPEEDSWKEYDLLQELFPSFRLEDKASFKGEGNDSDPAKPWASRPIIPYVRRQKV